jgi:pimeloyl-ACP methyl ester carboxylesterase
MRRTGQIIRTVVIGFGVCLLLLAALSTWNLVAEWQWRMRNPVPGAFYSIQGKQMHIVCTGTGSPAAVLESAAGARWMQWRKVQPALSAVTEVCSYDRAGHGWSEPRKGPRDAEIIVRELHSLLDQAGVKRPFVYAGESAGGLYVREYAREYPTELAGVALLDASSPQQIDELPNFRALWESDVRDYQRSLWMDRLRVWSGWERLMGNCASQTSSEIDCRPAYVDLDDGELPYFDLTSRQAGRLKSFGNIPLLIITRDTEKPPATARQAADYPVWIQEQEASKSLSPRSWRVIAHDSGHIVPMDRPDLVVTEMALLINYLRGGPSPPFGSTETK